jgi:conjugative transfer signal peptidase TraF
MIRGRFLLAGVVAAVTLATLTVPVSRYAVWNATASVPTGLYAIRGKASLHVGERVAIEPPPELRRLLAERHYLPTGVPLLKRIAAVRSQRVCRFGHGVTIDGDFAGVARARDRLGRPLPTWSGCRTLQTGELFVMNPDAPDSFDGRYFGPLRLDTVIGRATPVWTDEAGDGRHVWFADPREMFSPPPQKETDQCVSDIL